MDDLIFDAPACELMFKRFGKWETEQVPGGLEQAMELAIGKINAGTGIPKFILRDGEILVTEPDINTYWEQSLLRSQHGSEETAEGCSD